MDKDTYYKIVKANDPRFDGVFYLGVKSTGIYCRPVCKVPTPLKQNCNYFDSAAKAEAEGYRPCLRCRPEMAPQYSEFNQKNELIGMILEYFESHNYHAGIIGEAGKYFGLSPRHINRLFHDALGVAPKDYIMTKRLLRGKALLTDTKLSITRISELSGFGSPSRFSAALKKNYRLTPSAIRKQNKSSNDFIQINLYYRPPYSWELMMNFLKMRAIPHVEEVTDKGIYRRSLQIEDSFGTYAGWLEAEPNPDECKVKIKISNSLEKVIIPVIKKLRQAFDLDVDPKQLPKILNKGVRLPGCFDSFEVTCRAIIGQQVTVKAATTLSGRIAYNMGVEAFTPWNGIDRFFPSAKDINECEDVINMLGVNGIISSRSETIQAFAKEIVDENISFEKGQNIDELKDKLLNIKGIGPWTAEYVLMRAYSWPDAFPVSDLVIKNKLLEHLYDEDDAKLSESKMRYSKYILNKKYEKAANKWNSQYKPWRSYVTVGIWNDLIDWS